MAVPVLALAAFPGAEVYLPMVGRNPGVYPSQWYTTVWVYNPNAEAVDVTFALLERDKANTAPITFADVLQPGETRKYENAVQTLFGKSAWGAIRVTSAAKVVVNERFYDQPPGADEAATKGQYFAGVPPELAIGLGESTEILGAYQTQPAAGSEFRYNYGFVEVTGNQVRVRVTARDPLGAELSSREHDVRPYSQRQFAFANSFPAVSTENARLTVEVIAGNGKVIAYGTGIANGSQDPTTFEMATGWPAVAHDATLAGDGSADSPLGVAPGSLTAELLADGAVTLAKLSTTNTPEAATGAPSVQVAKVTEQQVLTTDGVSLSWLKLPTGGLDLPYYGIMTGSGQPAFEILDSGGGTSIRATTSSLNAPTLEVIQQDAHGTAIHAVKTVSIVPGEAGGITILAENNTPAGTAIRGVQEGQGAGVEGSGHIGVHGFDTGNDGFSAGVAGSSGSGKGVQGDSASGRGVWAWSDTGTALSAEAGTSAIAVRAEGKTNTAVWATTDSGFAAVHGASGAGGFGIYAESASGIAMRAVAHTDTAVFANTDSGFAGVDARGGSGIGLYAASTSNDAISATANSQSKSGIFATNSDGRGYAAYFAGKVHVTGFLEKSGGGFKIDHPLDPQDRYLLHSFVESPDMKDVYDGVAVLDDNGAAVVELPVYFEALNRDFRYQLTCIGGFAPVFVAEKISENRFKIAGGRPGLEVSWQVTGIRQDPWANRNRMVVEEEKREEERGTYLHPELYGAPEETGVAWSHRMQPPAPAAARETGSSGGV